MAFFCIAPAGALATESDDAWFRFEKGKPVYTRAYTASGLSTNYSIVGRDGLVWFAGFDGNLTSIGQDPGASPINRGDMLIITGKFGSAKGAPPEGPQFVSGLRGGQAFLSPPPAGSNGQVQASVTFDGLAKITASPRGTLLFWMFTRDASLWDKSGNNFFFCGGGFYMRVWWMGQMAVWAPLEHYMNHEFVSDSTRDLKGWNLYALTWAPGRLNVYANGRLIDQTTHHVANIPMLCLGTFGGQKSRVYDEVAVYNRILSPSEQREQYLALLKPAGMPEICAPSARQPVKVDGVLEASEWQAAAQVTGLLEGTPTAEAGRGQITDPLNEFWVQYDAGNLYVAVRSPWPKPILEQRPMTTGLSGALSKQATARDQVDPAKEDAIEILVGPVDQDGKAGKLYRFLVNGNTIETDERLDSPGRAQAQAGDRSWNSKWKVATQEFEQDGLWVMEAAIPWGDIGVKPRAGEAVAFNMARHWNLLKKGTDEWAWGTRPYTVTNQWRPVLDLEEQVSLGRLTLGAGDPVVRVEKVGDLMKGQVDFHATIMNPSAKAVTVNVTLKSNARSLNEERQLTVEPGASAPFSVTRTLEGYGDSRLVFEARPDTKTPLCARQVWDFIRKPSFDVTLQRFPSVGKLVVTLDCGFLQGYEPTNLHAEVIMTDVAGHACLTRTTEAFKTYRLPVEMDVSGLATGDYRLAARIIAGDNVVSENKDLPYQKNPLPDWLGNRVGYDFKNVPAPFTPVKRDKTGVAVWERRYEFGGRVLPTQITTLGMNILRAPMNLIIKLADGREIRTDTLPAKIEWSRGPAWTMTRWNKKGLPEAVNQPVSPDIRAEGTAVARSNGITIENRFWIEYDGLLWSDIRIHSDTDLVLTHAVLEVPITPAFSDVMNPPVSRIPTHGDALVYGPNVWIGNGYGGLQTLLLSKPWNLEPSKAGRVDPGTNGATLRITLLNGTNALSQLPQPLSLTLQATPVKARYPDYRRHVWHFEGCKTYFSIAGEYPQGHYFLPCADHFYGSPLVTPYSTPRNVPIDKWPTNWMAGSLLYNAVYVNSCALNINTAEGEEFKDEWFTHNSPEDRVTPGIEIIPNTMCAPSCRDYFLWRYGRLMDRIPYASLYNDGVNLDAYNDNNPYLKDTPGFLPGLLAGRNVLRRMYTLVKARFPDGIVFDHAMYNDLMLGKSFTDFQVEGEQNWPHYKPGMRNVKGIVTVDKYRAHYMGLNYGRIGCLDPKLGNQAHTTRTAQRQTGPSIAQHMQSLIMLHDSSFHLWDYSFPGEHTAPLRNALIRHEWGPQYLMIPYWDQTIVALPILKEAVEPWQGLYASFYVEPEKGARPKPVDSTGFYIHDVAGDARRVICIFSNESDWQGEMRVTLDWKKLGLAPDEVTVENAVHRFKVKYPDPKAVDSKQVHLKEDQFTLEDNPAEYARVEGATLVFPMTDWNYRMIVLAKK